MFENTNPAQKRPLYVSTAIPYVNAEPHVGFAYELLIADVLARAARGAGRQVWLQSGTDENSKKNIIAAQRQAVRTEDLVQANSERFRDLASRLDISLDGFVRTSGNADHRRNVELIWQALAQRGDLYKKAYRGQYCTGCEQFYDAIDAAEGVCPEHGTELETVEEENVFFRLSKYEPRIRELIESRTLRIEPEKYRQDILRILDDGLVDVSVSRPSSRTGGWGIAVPGDPTQVVYVWFDALINYLNVDRGTEGLVARSPWPESERVHVIGKGVNRFHSILWPAILLAAELPLPHRVVVHGYLTVDGAKIGKSANNTIDPVQLVEEYGLEALRLYLLKEFPLSRDGDFKTERLREIYQTELAAQLGNLLNRVVRLSAREEQVLDEGFDVATPLADAFRTTGQAVGPDYDGADPRSALVGVWALIRKTNEFVTQTEPWRAHDHRLTALRACHEALRIISHLVEPVLPAVGPRIRTQLAVSEQSELTWSTEHPATVAPDAVLFPAGGTKRP